jgi:hypothetical protein
VARGFEQDIATKAADAPGPGGKIELTGAELTVRSGPETGLTAVIGASGIVVGTGHGCDVRITDELVSRSHVELTADEHGVRVVDRASRNGTFLGNVRVKEVLLTEATVVRIGSTVLEIRVLGAPLTIELSGRSQLGDAIAYSSAMRHLFSRLERAARNDVTVLLEGDSGTGKEILARALHRESPRVDGPFVVVDCGAISENLIESELFGHERGAFTGAQAQRRGAFEQAHGGTIFLDEIGELPLDLQPKLLRALENRAFRRVGGSTRPRSIRSSSSSAMALRSRSAERSARATASAVALSFAPTSVVRSPESSSSLTATTRSKPCAPTSRAA